ncbi:MAG TPA: ABC transporter permease [Bryobacteraceae bacterium]|jgi:putative ABC transport system permease protein|nr:ABC transporter permease [Bryobacteraceae bacterium]
MLLDIRYAWRTLMRNPGFAAVAILTLALGIGANTAIFTVFNGVLLRPLPYPRPDRLAAVQEVVPKLAQYGPTLPVNSWHFREWRKQARAFEGLALVGDIAFTLTSAGEPERLLGARVSSTLFPMLGVQAEIGRTFFESEDQAGHDRVVVISDSLWTRRFHRDPKVVGNKLVLDGQPYEVVGVLPPAARIPTARQLYWTAKGGPAADIWKPFAIADDELTIMGDFDYGCVGRLRPGVSLPQATADLNAIQNGISQSMADQTALRVSLTDLQQQITGSSRAGLTLLLAATGAVLLIVVVNLANLLLARAAGRSRELAVRAAIGAGTGRLVRQMLTESMLLAIAGGALGALAARWALAAIVHNAPLDIPGLQFVHLDLNALAFVALVSIASGALFGILPAWRTAHADPQAALAAAGRGNTDRAGGRVRNMLIAAEVALSAICLVAAGLLLHSLVRLLHVDTGFRADHAVAMELSLPDTRYPDRSVRVRFVKPLLDRIAALPGVVDAGISNRGPLSGIGSNLGMWVEGIDMPQVDRPSVDYRCISPDYLRAVGIPLERGRGIAERDRGRLVGLVSAKTAQRMWPGQDPIGRRFQLGGGDNFTADPNAWVTVIGVVGDVRSLLAETPHLTVYLPYWQRDRADFSLVVRTAIDPLQIAPALRDAIHGLDRQLVVPRPVTLADIVDSSVRQRRFQMSLVMSFAIGALLLAAIGVYGVVSQSVMQRTKEIGIRLALGAPRTNLWMTIARTGLAPVIAGLAVGMAGAAVASRSIAGLLFGVLPIDPATYGAVIAALLLAGLLACWLPARRAAHLDPLVALREE